MWEADQGTAEQGQGEKVQGTAEKRRPVVNAAGFLILSNFVRILSQIWTGPEALKNKALSNFVLFVLFVPAPN